MVPTNEQGVVVVFAQEGPKHGFEIVSIQQGCPDAVVKYQDIEYRVEFEYQSANFDEHGHDIRDVDLIICWENTDGSILPVLALSEEEWYNQEIVLRTDTEREIAYWQYQAQYWENKHRRLQYKYWQDVKKPGHTGQSYRLDSEIDDRPKATVTDWRMIASELLDEAFPVSVQAIQIALDKYGYSPATPSTARRWAEEANDASCSS